MDASHDVIRYARAGYKIDEDSLQEILEDEEIQETYKIILHGLLIMDVGLNGRNGVTEHNKGSEAPKKRKTNDDEVGEKYDPQHELFLQHLRKDDKSYVIKCEQVVHGQRELMKVGRGDRGLTHKAAFVNCSVKNEPDDGVSVNTSRFSATYKNGVENKKAGNVESFPEVEILDGVAFAKGVLSSFVPSMTYNEVVEFRDPDCPNVVNEFRKEVIKILRKPFDRKEHKQPKEAIRAGSYLHYYPDLRKNSKPTDIEGENA